MMRALILSDSHGMGSNLMQLFDKAWQAIGPGPVDAYIHCGDGASDMERVRDLLSEHDPKAAIYCVRGNCDFGSDVPAEQLLTLGGMRILVCHGHRYHVKTDLIYLSMAARERGCQLALYGHTHIPDEEFGQVMMVNPGSAADGRMALLEIKDGVPKVRMLNLEGRPVNTWR